MGGKSTPAPPPSPDPFAVASASAGANKTTAIGNTFMANANETSPLGNVTYTRAPDQSWTDETGTHTIPSFNKATTLSPEQQNLYNQQTALGGAMNNLAMDQVLGLTKQFSNFDSAAYLKANPDVASAGVNPLQHYLQFGMTEGRTMPGTGNSTIGQNLPGSVTSLGNLPTLGTAPNAPTLQNTFDRGGQIQSSVPVSQAQSTFNNDGTRQQMGFGATANGIQQSIGANDFSADRQRVEEALYSRLNPQLDRDRSSLETKLVNQGLVRGTDAFNQAMDEANRQANDARMGVIAQGGAEQSRLFGLDQAKGQFANAAQQQDYAQQLGRGQFANAAQQANFGEDQARGAFANAAAQQNNGANLAAGQFANTAQQQQYNQNQGLAQFWNQAAQSNYANLLGNTAFNNQVGQQNFANSQTAADFANTARERALQEQIAIRDQPLNEISALMRGGQVSMPQFTPFKAGTMPASDLGSNVYNSAAMDAANWRTQAQMQAQDNAGLYGLGGAALGAAAKMWSDRRLKRDIVQIGTLANGLGWFSYRYANDNVPRQGVMADEVERVMPEAVYDIGGLKAVDYSLVLKVA